MRVTFLGTAAARPTPGRNVSAVLVEHDGTAVLLDCGEGTERQLLRFAPEASVNAIFVSHNHADHLLGVPALVQCLGEEGPTPEVHAPTGAVAAVEDALALVAAEMRVQPGVEPLEHEDEVYVGSLRVRAFSTAHKGHSLGYAVDAATDRDRKKVVYTGDTRPSRATVRAARGADLLVHEATFCEEEKARARATRHSTAAEAAGVAREAGVDRLALTHLSARYDMDTRTPAREARAVFTEAEVARDGLIVEL